MKNNINNKMMNFIKKELKTTNELIIRYLPTEEEKKYLSKYNINTKIIFLKQKGIATDYCYDIKYCVYYLN